MPAITIPREEIQPRPQVIKLTFIIQLHEIDLINDNRESEQAKGEGKKKKKKKKKIKKKFNKKMWIFVFLNNIIHRKQPEKHKRSKF